MPEQLYARRYPWDKWFKRKRFTLTPEDYNGRVDTMVVQIRNRATREGRKVSVKVDGTTIHVTMRE